MADENVSSAQRIKYAELRAIAERKLETILPAPTRKCTYSYEELYKKKDEEQKFIIPEILPANELCVFIGEDGIGKTQLMTQLCLSVCFGYEKFIGQVLNVRYKRCLIIATEESRKKWIKAAVKQAHRLEPNHSPADVKIDFTEASNFDAMPELKHELESLLNENRYDVIVGDALSDFFTFVDGEINSNSNAREILSYFQHVCNSYDTTMILIHHAAKSKIVVKRKEGKMFLEKNDSQGAGAITQKPRTVWGLTNDPKSIAQDGMSYKNYFHVLKANLMGKKFYEKAIELEFTAESLIHSPTGVLMDVELRENVTPVEVAAVDPNGKKATAKELSEEQHLTAMQKVFAEAKKMVRAELVAKIMQVYDVGKTKVEQKDGFLNHLMEIGLIAKCDFGFEFTPPVTEPDMQPIKLFDAANFSDDDLTLIDNPF